jgi:hypothetical protein
MFSYLYNLANFYYYKTLNVCGLTKSVNPIINGLYLGDHTVTSDPSILEALRIKLVINVTADIPVWHSCEVYQIQVDDTVEAEDTLFWFAPEAVRRIHQCLSSNQAVLVHCRAGISRSATVVACYLLQHCKHIYEKKNVLEDDDEESSRQSLLPDEAIDRVIEFMQKARPVVFRPAPRFRNLLCNYFQEYC